jgi:hypothetical protein
MSKKKQRKLSKISVAQLKALASRPELVEVPFFEIQHRLAVREDDIDALFSGMMLMRPIHYYSSKSRPRKMSSRFPVIGVIRGNI